MYGVLCAEYRKEEKSKKKTKQNKKTEGRGGGNLGNWGGRGFSVHLRSSYYFDLLRTSNLCIEFSRSLI